MKTRIKRSEVNLLIKYFLFLFNFAFLLIGLALVGISSWILYGKEKVVVDAIDFFFDPAAVMCVTGCCTTLLAFLGSAGALREYIWCLTIYRWTLTVFFFLEVLFSITVFVFYYYPDFTRKINLIPEDTFKAAIIKYRDDEDMQNLIDSIQKTLKCCGLSKNNKGYQDWNSNLYFNCTSTNKSPEKCSVPPSCCIMKPGDFINIKCGSEVVEVGDKGVLKEGSNIGAIYTRGCLKALGDWIKHNGLIIGGILLGILIPQLFLACIAQMLKEQIQMQLVKQEMNKRNRLVSTVS